MLSVRSGAESTPVDGDRQICVCYDVYLTEILQAIHQGADSVEKISALTYACQGCGSCRDKIESVLKSNRS